jgi:xylose dehydrogenase (NAD/NADP)
MAVLRWGILGGSSRISRHAVAPAIEASERGELVASASRAADGSDGPYAELLDHPGIDIVYIPMPNGLHRRWVTAALAAGKHVLCEKPLGMDAAEAEAMFVAADGAGRILIEAYMAPFHPRTHAMERLIADGVLGELRSMRATFTFPLVSVRPGDHRLDPTLGGGASLDVGIYCTAPMLWAAGREPLDVAATAMWHTPVVDRSLSAFLDFGAGLAGSFAVSFELPVRQRLELAGTQAAITSELAFNPGMDATVLELARVGGETETTPFEPASAYLGMIEHVSAVVLDGVTPRHGRNETLAVAHTLDRVRAAATR